MAYNSFVTESFMKTPWIGTLPERENVVETYDIESLLKKEGVTDPSKVSEILVYAFFTGLGEDGSKQTLRAVYEIYTESESGSDRYSQLMNAVFNQPDTVINCANLWIPYTTGKMNARIPKKWMTQPKPGDATAVIPSTKDRKYNNLSEAMEAYTSGEQTLFKELFLLGYRLKD